jgi:MFS family permease
MSRSDDSEVAPRTVIPYPAGRGGTRSLRLPWAGLLALSTAAFIDVVNDLAPAGLLPGMSASLGVPEGQIGTLVSGYAAASALGAIPLTALLRGLPRRPVLCSVLAGFALVHAMTAVSSSYPLSFACRLLAGALGGVLWAMLAPAAARFAPTERRGRAVAIMLAGITVALGLGIPAAAALASPLGIFIPARSSGSASPGGDPAESAALRESASIGMLLLSEPMYVARALRDASAPA